MTVFKHPNGTTYRYDFWWKGNRYTGSTEQTTKEEARLVEADIKRNLRLQAGGVLPAETVTSPRFQDWAEVYLEYVLKHRKDVKSPKRIERLLRCVLRFFGRRPENAPEDDANPYHDLSLSDPIADPRWLLKFEDWMAARRLVTVAPGRAASTTRGRGRPLSGQTKNQYRSVVSQMYALALRPEFRKESAVAVNPMAGVPRDRGVERTSTVSVEQLRAWLRNASYHVRLAVAIAALAPKLRLSNVLRLRWKDIDQELRFITVHDHKTETHLRKPLVVPVNEQLREILQDAKRRRASSAAVVAYQGKPVKQIAGGIQAAAEAAGLEFGRFGETSVTFHTIRHTMATMLAELSDLDGLPPLDPSVRQKAMGHKRLETTARYTHIRPTVEARALERLSNVTPIKDIVMAERNRPPRGSRTGTVQSVTQKSLGKSRNPPKVSHR